MSYLSLAQNNVYNHANVSMPNENEYMFILIV